MIVDELKLKTYPIILHSSYYYSNLQIGTKAHFISLTKLGLITGAAGIVVVKTALSNHC